jgi:IMP dehydrogenase
MGSLTKEERDAFKEGGLPSCYHLTKSEEQFINQWLKARGLPTKINVTYGDMTIPERYSEIRSRLGIDDFSTQLTHDLSIDMPVILANMECLAGARAIVAIEREGGLGIVPQMIPINQRLEILEKVGRANSAYVGEPLTISPNKTLAQAKAIMKKFGIYSLVVIDENRRPIGILSTRDWKYEGDDNRLVSALMGGKRKLYVAPKDISFEEAAKILRKYRIEKLPLVDKKWRLCGLITAHGLFYKWHYPRATRDEKHGRFLRVGSIGVGRTFTKKHLAEVEAQVRKGICMLLIDTARAFSINTEEAIKAVKKRFPKLPLMVGNVSTPEGAKFLFSLGVDIVKVGQGPGEACRTREVGVGIPQLSAVAKCAAVAYLFNEKDGRCRTIVADGGIKNAGDIAKAIIAGASAVMCGKMFIGTEESEAHPYFNKQGLRVKDYIGSASFHAQQERMEKGTLDRARRPEGVKDPEIPVTGTIKSVMEDIIGGLRSSMSYRGVSSIEELRLKGKMERQTSAGLFEGIKKK